MKVVCTGHAGFLGSHLVEDLWTWGTEKIIGYDNLSRGKVSLSNLQEISIKCDTVVGDILDLPRLKTVIKSGVDVVYHMAALPSHRLALLDPHAYLQIDLAGTTNVLEAARLCDPKPLVVFASSNKVYGKQPCPWQEDKLPQPEGPYAVAKWASEKICEMYNKYFDVPCVVIRYHHVAGPRSNPDLALSVFVEAADRDKPIEVHGHFGPDKKFESCSANYTHVDDAVRGTLLAAEKYSGFNIFNLANKKETLVSKMAERVVKELGSKSQIVQVEMDRHETLNHISNVSKAEEKLGFIAEISVEKAIDDYIVWRTK